MLNLILQNLKCALLFSTGPSYYRIRLECATLAASAVFHLFPEIIISVLLRRLRWGPRQVVRTRDKGQNKPFILNTLKKSQEERKYSESSFLSFMLYALLLRTWIKRQK